MKSALSCKQCVWAAALVFALLLPSAARADAVNAVPALDLPRFVGSWFVIAQYPTKFQKKCASNNQMLYALDDKPGHFQMGVFCTLRNGSPENVNYTGKRDRFDDGRLKVSSLVLFSKKYWVLALDPSYRWAVLAMPNRKALWILSREQVLAPQDLQQARAALAAQGFNPEKLVTISQVPPGYTEVTVSGKQ